MRSPVPLLRVVLRSNATFSLLSGLATLLGSAALATEIGMPAGELRGLGIQLLIFAGFLFFLSARSSLGQGWTFWAVLVLGIIDLLWVVGTAQVLASGALAASTLGVWMMAGVAVVVGTFGCVELWIWRALRRDRRVTTVDGGHPAK